MEMENLIRAISSVLRPRDDRLAPSQSTADEGSGPAAALGDPGAQYERGQQYFYGRGVRQDFQAAAKWCRLAAQQGHADAQNKLGLMHEYSRRGLKDDVQAVKWYRLAAEQGHADAQNNLGFMYAMGKGVAQDDVQARRWYRLAADQGHANAQFNLGWEYENGGRSLAPNPVAAYALYGLCMANPSGDPSLAAKRRKCLATRMTSQQIYAAKGLAFELSLNRLVALDAYITNILSHSQTMAQAENLSARAAPVESRKWVQRAAAERRKTSRGHPRRQSSISGARQPNPMAKGFVQA